ncbi:hypothetical protein [Rhizobium phage RHEph12]|nr:hypothetical protein [Rhizobium phage RHEph12]
MSTREVALTVARVKRHKAKRRANGWKLVSVWVATEEQAIEIKKIAKAMREATK